MNEVTKSQAIAGGYGGMITPIRDSERARMLARRRWDKVKQAMREGVRDAAGNIPDLKRTGDLGMIRAIIEAHSMNAYDASARGSASSANLVLSAYKPDDDKRSDSPMPPDDQRDMQEILAQYRAWRARGESGCDNSNYHNQSEIASSGVVSGDVVSDAD